MRRIQATPLTDVRGSVDSVLRAAIRGSGHHSLQNDSLKGVPQHHSNGHFQDQHFHHYAVVRTRVSQPFVGCVNGL